MLSSSRIVTSTVVLAPRVTSPVGAARFTAKLLFGSAIVSLITVTEIVLFDSPGPKVSVPLVAVKSMPDSAEPEAVPNGTVMVLRKSPVRVTTSATVPTFSSTFVAASANCTTLSSSVMVTVAFVIPPTNASPVTAPSATENCRDGSTSRLFARVIVLVSRLTPGPNVRMFVTPV